jgi:hypothetical protein
MHAADGQSAGLTPLDPDRLTWAAMLRQWVQFARSALALPADDLGTRLRDSVPDIIMLQAVWFALHHLAELDAAERALGLDRAELLIEKHAAVLRSRFGHALPQLLGELIRDAEAQLAAAQREP